MSRPLRRLSEENGQALVEFALVTLLLLILLVGVFEFARAWNAYQVITDAAREGARTAVVADPNVTLDSCYSVVRHALARAGLDSTAAQVAISGWGEGTGSPASVQIQYPYEFVFVGTLLEWAADSSAITLGTSIVMRNE